MSTPRSSPSKRRAVTLLEVVLAMSLLVLLTTMTYWFYSSAMATGHRGTKAADKIRLARVVLDRFATEIRQATTINKENSVGIRGEKEHIAISTLRVPSKELTRLHAARAEPPPAEYDLVQVEYKIARHPEVLHEDGYEQPLGLARIERLIPRAVDPSQISKSAKQPNAEKPKVEETKDDEGLTPEEQALDEFFMDDEELQKRDLGSELDIAWEELYAPEIRYLRFCYYDGNTWWDDWQINGENPLPQLVQITIGFEGHPPCGEELGMDKVNEEFCECLNKDPVDCVPLTKDQYSTIVRVTQADPLFRSRVTREGQFLSEQLTQEEEEPK